MDWQRATLFLPLLAATGVASSMFVYAWKRRSVPGARPLALLMASLAWWTLTYALELGSSDFAGKLAWAKLRYFGIYGTLLSWLSLALTFSGRDRWLTARRVLLLLVIPVLTLGVLATNHLHGLFWSHIQLDPASPALVSEHGGWFWVHFVFVYGLLLATTVLVLVESLRSAEARELAAPLMLAVIVPWAANGLHLSGITPWGSLDPTPFALTLSGLGFAFALFRLGFLDIVPIAQAAVVDAMPDPMLVIDRRGRLVDLNPAAERLLGLTLVDASGRLLEELLAPWPELCRRAASLGEGKSEVAFGTSPGARSYELRVAPLVSHKRFGGRVFVWRDVTEERRLERLREDLTHAMVHDLRGPLTSVAGTLDLFDLNTAERLTPKERELLGVARLSTNRLTALVDAILEVSRLESGQLPVVQQALQLLPLVEETLALHAPQAQTKGLQLSVDVPASLPDVSADPDLLRRVLQNLVGNGVKFTTPGGQLRISARLDHEAPARVVVDVTDTGRGIPDELRGRLFQKFAAGPQSGRGTGLGLAFCRLAIEAHGGRIWADSRPGEGATFRFTLATAA